MIQITPQMRILVAVEAVDGRKGIDSLAQLCQEKLHADPFSGCLFMFRSRRGTRSGSWSMTGRDSGSPQALVERALPLVAKGAEASRGACMRIRRSCCWRAGNPDIGAAPVWRRVSA